MNSIKIRKYKTDGPGYIRAEVVWTKNSKQTGSDSKSYNIPSGGIASIGVTQAEYYMTVCAITGDVPFNDTLQLPITPGIELPKKLIGANFPSCQIDYPYVLTPLDDTRYGFALSIGLVPIPRLPPMPHFVTKRAGLTTRTSRRPAGNRSRNVRLPTM